MSLAWISVAALVLAITLSCTTTINVGVLSLALALIVGVGLADMSVGRVLDGFPTDLFITLLGITLLFAIAEVNGTLARLTERAVRLCRGHAGALPVMFFVIGFVIATIGAGATPASALLAPPAMAVAARAGVPPLLMAIMAGNGALAGTLSPFAPTGVVAHSNMEQIGLGGYEWATFTYNALAHTFVGVGGFLLLGGWKLFGRNAARADAASIETVEPLNVNHWLTTAGIVALIASVVGFDAAGFDVNVGMVAVIVATVLVLLRTVDEPKAIAKMPWGVIVMVTGVTVLIALLRETEGLALITTGIANLSTPATIEPIVAFGVGLVSVYSSTSGVVLPAFLPMVPDLATRLGGLDPFDYEDAERKLADARAGRLPGLAALDVTGVIPVHVGGLMVDVAATNAFAERHRLWVVEDAAHAFPAAWRANAGSPWIRCGEQTSKVTCFSFYANKTITTGEGGMAVTDDAALADRIRLMSLHGLSRDAWDRYKTGSSWDYRIVAPGYKYNLTDLAAAMGLHQLPRAEDMRVAREWLASEYRDRLADVEAVELPAVVENRLHAWHLFPIRLRLDRLTIDRAAFIEALQRAQIGSSVHWRPLHLHPYYQEHYKWRPSDCPVATREWPRLISLPLFPSMSNEEQDAVIAAVTETAQTRLKD